MLQLYREVFLWKKDVQIVVCLQGFVVHFFMVDFDGWRIVAGGVNHDGGGCKELRQK